MTASALLVVAGLTVIVLGPRLLTAGHWSVRRPRVAIGLWLTAILAGGCCLLVALGTWLFPAPVWQRSSCTGCGAFLSFTAGCVGTAALTAIVGIIGARAEQQWRRDQRTRFDVASLATAGAPLAHHSRDDVQVAVVDSAELIAVSSRCFGRQIVLSSGLVAALRPAELSAVVQHERAHLMSSHDRILRLAMVNAASFPWLPGARAFAARVDLLLELDADDRAAAVCGRADMASALNRLADLTDSASARMRATRLHPAAAAV